MDMGALGRVIRPSLSRTTGTRVTKPLVGLRVSSIHSKIRSAPASAEREWW